MIQHRQRLPDVEPAERRTAFKSKMDVGPLPLGVGCFRVMTPGVAKCSAQYWMEEVKGIPSLANSSIIARKTAPGRLSRRSRVNQILSARQSGRLRSTTNRLYMVVLATRPTMIASVQPFFFKTRNHFPGRVTLAQANTSRFTLQNRIGVAAQADADDFSPRRPRRATSSGKHLGRR